MTRINKICKRGISVIPILLLSLSFYSIACNKQADPASTVDKDTTLLFVGNSLTYTNDLPLLVKVLAKSKGSSIKVDMLALPNYALLDHLTDGNLQKMIAGKKYSHIIVQQGPSSQAEGRAMLLDAATAIKALCDASNSKLAFYMVWPAHANYTSFDGVIRNYTEAATITHSILCPVGKVWKEYMDKTNDLSYYGPDLFHPSLKGSQVAAEEIFNSLFK
jgi:hypothetical protein